MRTTQKQAIGLHLHRLLYNWHSEEMSADTPESRMWWEFWKTDPEQKRSLLVIGRYLLEGLDDFVLIARTETAVEEEDPSSYKDTILEAITSLYNAVMVDAKIPWWVKPFGNSVKNIIINVIGSLLIDYIMNKYAGGSFS